MTATESKYMEIVAIPIANKYLLGESRFFGDAINASQNPKIAITRNGKGVSFNEINMNLIPYTKIPCMNVMKSGWTKELPIAR